MSGSRLLTLDFGRRPDDDPKVQVIRAIDLFVMGPAMIWIGATHPRAPTWLKAFIVVSGIGTSVFNGANLVRCLERKDRS